MHSHLQGPSCAIDVTLVVGGKYHDFDFARLRLLQLMAEHEQFRVTVRSDFEDIGTIEASSILVSYTCDVRPTLRAQKSIRAWVIGGGRWLALHGTNAALEFTPSGDVASPRVFPLWADTLGSQFIAHPPQLSYRVDVCGQHPVVRGVAPFTVDDELYLSEYPDRDALQPLLATTWRGRADGFAEADWDDVVEHLVMYLRPLGGGCVLYNTLGHCRGHYDMRPVTEYYPQVERGSWESATYVKLLRRSLWWARDRDDDGAHWP